MRFGAAMEIGPVPMLRILRKYGRFRPRVIAGVLVGAAAGLSTPLFLGLRDDMQGWPGASKFEVRAGNVGFHPLEYPDGQTRHTGHLTIAIIVLFWATIGAVVFRRSS